jgi:G:T-mismatch repair DNA endonuclease (very short patch repair protein)
LQKNVNKKKSIINIFNDDNLCALRAILIGKSLVDLKKKIIKRLPSTSALNKQVREICKKLKLPNKAMGIEEIKQVERYLKIYSINVLEGRRGYATDVFLYKGPLNKYFIYILLSDSHYNVIRSMKSTFKKKKYCNYCKQGYDDKMQHFCLATCFCCKKQDCVKSVEGLKCSKCFQKAKNEECLFYHNEYICKRKVYCDICKQVYITKNHVCDGQKWCVNCHAIVTEEEHLCYLQADKVINKKRYPLIFFDYECYQKDSKHVPNYIVAKKICVSCLDSKNESCLCENKEFLNNNDFCEWLFDHDKNAVAICHNFKGYDSCFVMEWILENMTTLDQNPTPLMNGSKILSLVFRKVKIIDSLLFLPMALDKFPKTFEIKELKKGFFPHGFNLEENQKYVGVWPSKEDFGIKFMTDEKKKEFEEWYEKNSNSVYDFQQELQAYCKSDVELLMQGCLAFRKSIIEVTKSKDDPNFLNGIDPFCVSVTIASLCHYIFRNKMLKKNQIAILPQNGYYNNQNHSIKAIQWLEFLSMKKNLFIKHARNGEEEKIAGYPVDGYNKDSNTVYQFHGCFWHGHPACYKAGTVNKVKLKSMGAIYKQHMSRMSILQKAPHNGKKLNIVEIWECEFDKMCKEDDELKKFLKDFDIKLPLNVRDSFYGGRTEPFMLHYKCKENEQIKYYDITSLYPCVQKYEKFPIGHPKIIINNFNSIWDYFGFAKLSIIPPRKLYVPVLPIKANGKLLFALCQTCANNNIEKCTHTDSERAIRGTYCTEEIKEAIRQGYVIEKLYEVWHWETTSDELFKEYIDTFLKGKQEASGYPDYVKTPEDEANYIADYFEKEGILLDRNKIKYNAGMRAVLKLLLNSFWGKFGQKDNKLMFKIITKVEEWLSLITNEQFIVHRADHTNNKYLQVYYKHKTEINECESKTNCALASFVTCYGRLRLYTELKKLNVRLVYCDTDSVIFISRIGDYEPLLGSYLGQFTNEIDGKKGILSKK